jgi:hypothetical protein
MSQVNDKNMKWILFWTFLILFVLSVLGTLGVVFFGFGTPTDSERELLVKGLIGEIALCVIALLRYCVILLNIRLEKRWWCCIRQQI